MILAAPIFILIAASAQHGQKESNPKYASHIQAIRAKLSTMEDFERRNELIAKDLYQLNGRKDKLSDLEVLGATYRLIYRDHYLGFNTPDESTTEWAKVCKSKVKDLKDSIEKDICLAYFDFNETNWLFDRYPEWRKNPILTMLCFVNSAHGVTSQERYTVFKSAYEPTVKEIGPSYRRIGIDAMMSLGTYVQSKDKKHLRDYIEKLRLYATKTPDRGSAEQAVKMAKQYEEWNFGKSGGG